MKILAVSARYPTSVQTWFINYLEAVELKGVTASTLSLEPGETPYHPRVDQVRSQTVFTYRAHRLPDLARSLLFSLSSGHLLSIVSILRRLRRQGCHWKELFQGIRGLHLYPRIQADLIHCHSEKAAFRMLPLLLLLDKPLVLTFHGLPPQGVPDISARQRRVLAANVETTLFNTAYARNQYRSLVRSDAPSTLIRQGINVADFPFSPRPFPTPGAPIRLLTVGRIDRLKGHRLIIDALADLDQNGYKFEYRIIGAGYFHSDLAQYIEDKSLGDRVFIEPPVFGPALLSRFHDHDVFVLPSYTEPGQWAETQGIVIQEAQACGLPVIASDSGGIPECVTDGDDALLFRQNDSAAFSDALSHLRSSEALWNQLVRNGRDTVEQRYSLGSMGDALMAVYEPLTRKDP